MSRGATVDVTCSNCERNYTKELCRASRAVSQFCSRSCHAQYRRNAGWQKKGTIRIMIDETIELTRSRFIGKTQLRKLLKHFETKYSPCVAIVTFD